MSRRRSVGAFVAAAASAAVLAAAAVPAQTPVSHPFATAVYATQGVPDIAKIPASGATFVRLTLSWPSVAPATEPQTWKPSDPADPNYDWSKFDPVVLAATAHHLQILVTITGAPTWAQGSPPGTDGQLGRTPDATAFGDFAYATASRYSGSFEKLPRIRYFQAWNEPNISISLVPQLVDEKPVAVEDYRLMLNAFAKAVHLVHRDNVVIAGGLAPFRDITPDILAQDTDWGPLSFMRALLCVSESGAPTCRTRVNFDIWATHPYTSGGPEHNAVLPNDVSLGDLPKMQAVLDQAAHSGHLTNHHPGFWVTEFSWDSNPPDRQGVPTALLTRWIAEAQYRMWADGISLVTWLQVRDEPLTDFYQSGLWYLNGKPKPSLQAFRFPLVALPENGQVLVWGKTPHGEHRRVLIEQSLGGAWKRVATLTPDTYGVFQATLSVPARGRMRAFVANPNELSPPFGLAPVPDRIFNPFGNPTQLEPGK